MEGLGRGWDAGSSLTPNNNGKSFFVYIFDKVVVESITNFKTKPVNTFSNLPFIFLK